MTFMVGGSEADFGGGLLPELLGAMGKKAVRCGGVGAGQSTKLCNNHVLGIHMAAVAEGLALGKRLGLDPKVLSEVFNTSSARCWSSDSYNPVPGVMEGVPAARGYRNGFLTDLMVKDMRLAGLAAAGAAVWLLSLCGVPCPPWTAILPCLLATSLCEALTGQVDNLTLPLVMLTVLNTTIHFLS